MPRNRTNSATAQLHIGSVHGRSALLGSQATSPLCLLTPRACGASVWTFTSSFGGGMVAGDQTRLDVVVDAGATSFLGTQASTKIYRNPLGLPCSHRLRASVGKGALLAFAPDPVQCFAGSSYEQAQEFDLAEDASLVLVDWISAGRLARGERWEFDLYSSRNLVRRQGRPVFIDCVRLENHPLPISNPFRAGAFNCLATLALFGPKVSSQAHALLQAIAQNPVQPVGDLVISASPVAEGAVFRFAGANVEVVGRALHARLGFLSKLLDDDPWRRKW